ncbi:MAG: cell division protein ZapD [Rhodocyclaceae bacterium]|nr:cell division protein ZapD [Rhodocyclaceae bacterium]
MIEYEYPLNERIRTLLRLEDLGARLDHFRNGEHALDHFAAISTLFELQEVISRTDLKVDLLQELERQRQTIEAYRDMPDVSSEALDAALAEIHDAVAGMHRLPGKISQHLRENEWLMGIRSRATIPGGMCPFDLPSYHYWLNCPPAQRRADIESWLLPLRPIQDAILIILRLLRNSSTAEAYTAHKGVYQLVTSSRKAQMLRLRIAHGQSVVPEISASRHAISIRFLLPDTSSGRPQLAARDIGFDLTFCNL